MSRHTANAWRFGAVLALVLLTAVTATGCGGVAAKSDLMAPRRSAAPTTQTSATPPEPAVVGTITVAEGSQLARDIIPQLKSTFGLSTEEVKSTLSAARSPLIGKKVEGFRRMEGLIPPGAYPVREGSTLDQLVADWVAKSQKRYDSVLSSVSDPNGLGASERLTLGSIVEAECLNGEHQKEAAAVFLNRLKRGAKLQSCVTAEYACGYQRPYLLYKDVEISNPYNTYHVSGLPRGPICSVSDASLAAAVGRSEFPDIYYFFYDYMKNDMQFFSDYARFQGAGAVARHRFEKESPVRPHDKIDKQERY